MINNSKATYCHTCGRALVNGVCPEVRHDWSYCPQLLVKVLKKRLTEYPDSCTQREKIEVQIKRLKEKL